MSEQQWDYVKEKKRMLMYIRGSDTIELNPYILVHNNYSFQISISTRET